MTKILTVLNTELTQYEMQRGTCRYMKCKVPCCKTVNGVI